MPETSASTGNVRDAERIRRRIWIAVVEMAASSQRLMDALEEFSSSEPPLVDGEAAIVEGEPVDLVEWLRSRVIGHCTEGTLAEGLQELAAEATSDPLERLADYVRLNR